MSEFSDVEQEERDFKNPLQFIRRQLIEIRKELHKMEETQDQEAADINAIAGQVTAIGTGITALEAALASAGSTTPAVDAALANLKTVVANTAGLLPPAQAPAPTPSPTPAPTGP